LFVLLVYHLGGPGGVGEAVYYGWQPIASGVRVMTAGFRFPGATSYCGVSTN